MKSSWEMEDRMKFIEGCWCARCENGEEGWAGCEELAPLALHPTVREMARGAIGLVFVSDLRMVQIGAAVVVVLDLGAEVFVTSKISARENTFRAVVQRWSDDSYHVEFRSTFQLPLDPKEKVDESWQKAWAQCEHSCVGGSSVTARKVIRQAYTDKEAAVRAAEEKRWRSEVSAFEKLGVGAWWERVKGGNGKKADPPVIAAKAG